MSPDTIPEILEYYQAVEDALRKYDHMVDGSAPAKTPTTPGASVAAGNQMIPSETMTYEDLSPLAFAAKELRRTNKSLGRVAYTVDGPRRSIKIKQPIYPPPSDRLSAIAYDKHHLPRTYPHKWVQDAAASSWRCNCPIEPMRVSAAMLEAYKG